MNHPKKYLAASSVVCSVSVVDLLFVVLLLPIGELLCRTHWLFLCLFYSRPFIFGPEDNPSHHPSRLP